ncbi:MAG: DUF6786 family protein [Thermoguttaceae bacterium]
MPATLIQTLSAVGKPTELYQSPDGSRILLLPYGGRVLGLFAPGNDENFYWTHPALQSAASAREFYASDLWHNSGGDRTWLSPEADIFFPKFPDLSNYFQPRQLDPGQYQVDRHGGAVRLVNRLSLTMARSGAAVDLEIAKSVGPAPNPLRYERGLSGLEDVEYAGYTQHTSLEILGEATARVGLWNLVQMPHGGDLLIPTYIRAEPKIYFNSAGTIPPEDLLVTDHLVRYKMRQTGEHKLGVRAVSTAGRVGYLYRNQDRWDLIVRNFSVNPSGEYIDVPWSDTEDLGYSTQACNVNSGLGQFSELEYHIPAIGAGTGRNRCDDVAQVWAFRGPQQRILAVTQALLSPRCG